MKKRKHPKDDILASKDVNPDLLRAFMRVDPVKVKQRESVQKEHAKKKKVDSQRKENS